MTLTDTYASTYLDTYGVPSAAFPVSPLDLRAELQLAGTWTDVSTYMYQRQGTSPSLTITRGRPDETQTATPGSAAWQWNNRDGRFSPKNPLGPYFGQLARNSQVRFSVPATGNYLRLEVNNADRAFVNSNATISPTGSLELRIALRLSDWQGCVLAARYDNTQPSWYWLLNANGTLTWSWFDSGGTQRTATSDAPVPYTSGDFAMKVTLDSTAGNVTFYTAASIDGTYTQLGDAVAATGGAATTVRAGNAPLVVGYSFNLSPAQALGRVYEFRLYSGIAGSVVADGVFSAQPAGTTSWTDSASNAWSLSGGGEISSRDYRYHGLMSSQPPKWDSSGRDQYVAAQAGGPLRILGQGSKPPVQSPMKRAVLAETGSLLPAAYWPMEDGPGATQFGPAIGPNAMTWTSGTPTLATDSSFICSAPLPTLGGAAPRGLVAAYGGSTAWAVRFLANIPTLPGSQQTLFQVNVTGGLAAIVVVALDASSNMILTAYDSGLNIIANTGAVSWTGGVNQPLWWSIEATASGSNVKYSLVSLQPGASSGLSTSATSAATGVAGQVQLVIPALSGTWTDTVMGHVTVQGTWTSLFTLAGPLDAWTGEAAGTRFARLCGENGWPCRMKGSPAVSALMGPQGVATLQTLLQECETADRGQLGEARECAGFSYRTLASMLNQPAALTLSYASSQPGGVGGSADDSGLDPTYDDLLTRNDWSVTRGSSTGSQGATVRATLNDGSAMSITGLTDYGDTATVNVEFDSQLPDLANWMVHVGTVDEHRWPVVPLNLARSAMTALQGAAMTVDAGDLVELDSVPNVVLFDPVRQLALGFTEALGGKFWTMSLQEVPASPYTTIVLDDPVLGVLDTDGSALHATATYPQSTIQVDTLSGFPLWTTNASDFPFDINVAGMRLTVTNITGTSNPQVFTVTPAVNGVQKTLPGGADVRLWTPPILALT